MGGFSLGHLTVIEAVWLTASLIGLLFGALNLRNSLRDRQEANAVANGMREARMVVANGYVFRNRIRVAIFVWWAMIGAGYGFFELPDPPRIAGLLGLLATVFAWTAIGAQEVSERRELDGLIAQIAARRLAQAALEETARNTERTALATERIADSADDAAEALKAKEQ